MHCLPNIAGDISWAGIPKGIFLSMECPSRGLARTISSWGNPWIFFYISFFVVQPFLPLLLNSVSLGDISSVLSNRIAVRLMDVVGLPKALRRRFLTCSVLFSLSLRSSMFCIDVLVFVFVFMVCILRTDFSSALRVPRSNATWWFYLSVPESRFWRPPPFFLSPPNTVLICLSFLVNWKWCFCG